MDAALPSFKKCGYLFNFHFPFDHHLLYKNLVIPDTHLCTWWCRIHLHPLLGVFENFPVTLKMYFLYSVWSLSLTDWMTDRSAGRYLLFAWAGNVFSSRCCSGCLNAQSHSSRFSGYEIPHSLFSLFLSLPRSSPSVFLSALYSWSHGIHAVPSFLLSLFPTSIGTYLLLSFSLLFLLHSCYILLSLLLLRSLFWSLNRLLGQSTHNSPLGFSAGLLSGSGYMSICIPDRSPWSVPPRIMRSPAGRPAAADNPFSSVPTVFFPHSVRSRSYSRSHFHFWSIPCPD